MIKLQKSCASFVKGKYCSMEDVASLKWLLVPERIDFTVLKMTFKGLNERMPSNFQICIKEKKWELRTATETIKLTLTSEPNYESHFLKYATTLYNEVPKSIQEAEKYCAVVPKFKRYLFDKTLARSLCDPECDVWKEKRIVTLMSNLAFEFISCVCFPARSPGEELFFLCNWCDAMLSFNYF